MPRIRTLKPEHRQHRKVGALSDRQYRLWVGMICEADDEGRLNADPGQLRATIFGYHHAVTDADVQTDLEQIHKVGLIVLYTGNEGSRPSKSIDPEHPSRTRPHPRMPGTHPRLDNWRLSSAKYAVFPDWAVHQRIHVRHYVKSRLPQPPVVTPRRGTGRVRDRNGTGTVHGTGYVPDNHGTGTGGSGSGSGKDLDQILDTKARRPKTPKGSHEPESERTGKTDDEILAQAMGLTVAEVQRRREEASARAPRAREAAALKAAEGKPPPFPDASPNSERREGEGG